MTLAGHFDLYKKEVRANMRKVNIRNTCLSGKFLLEVQKE